MKTRHLRKPGKPGAQSTTHVLPKVGSVIALNHELVVLDKPDSNTKLTKLRYVDGSWVQIPRQDAGLLVFFAEQVEVDHTHFVIRSFIPTKTACYASPYSCK